MKKIPLLFLVLLLASGCVQFKVPTGQTEDVMLNKDGKPYQVTTTQIPLGDSQYYHTRTQQIVARAAAASDQTKATSIADITKYTMEHASSKAEMVLVGVIGSQTIRDTPSSIAPALKAIGKRPTSGYDAFIHGIDKLSEGIPIVFREIEVNKTIRHAQDSAGSSQVTNVSGSGNTVDTVSRTTKVDVRNNIATRGENAGVTVDNQQTAAGCPTGDCDKKGDQPEPVLPSPEPRMCTGERGSVPIDHIDEDGTAWVSATCSCGSYQAYHCNIF